MTSKTDLFVSIIGIICLPTMFIAELIGIIIGFHWNCFKNGIKTTSDIAEDFNP